MVSALGGPADFGENYEKHLPKAPIVRDVVSNQSGFVTSMQTRDIGVAVVEMGGGRRTREDEIDHAVGLSNLVSVGAKIQKGDRLFTVHANDETMFEMAKDTVLSAIEVGASQPSMTPIVVELIV